MCRCAKRSMRRRRRLTRGAMAEQPEVEARRPQRDRDDLRQPRVVRTRPSVNCGPPSISQQRSGADPLARARHPWHAGRRALSGGQDAKRDRTGRREALRLRRESAGSKHPDVATQPRRSGRRAHVPRRHDEAEPLLREALAIRRKLSSRRRPAARRQPQQSRLPILAQGKPAGGRGDVPRGPGYRPPHARQRSSRDPDQAAQHRDAVSRSRPARSSGTARTRSPRDPAQDPREPAPAALGCDGHARGAARGQRGRNARGRDAACARRWPSRAQALWRGEPATRRGCSTTSGGCSGKKARMPTRSRCSASPRPTSPRPTVPRTAAVGWQCRISRTTSTAWATPRRRNDGARRSRDLSRGADRSHDRDGAHRARPVADRPAAQAEAIPLLAKRWTSSSSIRRRAIPWFKGETQSTLGAASPPPATRPRARGCCWRDMNRCAICRRRRRHGFAPRSSAWCRSIRPRADPRKRRRGAGACRSSAPPPTDARVEP